MKLPYEKLLCTNVPSLRMLVLIVVIAAILNGSFLSIRVPGLEVVVDATPEQTRPANYEGRILEQLDDVDSRLILLERAIAEGNANIRPGMDAERLEDLADSELEWLMEMWLRCLSNFQRPPPGTNSKRR